MSASGPSGPLVRVLATPCYVPTTQVRGTYSFGPEPVHIEVTALVQIRKLFKHKTLTVINFLPINLNTCFGC